VELRPMARWVAMSFPLPRRVHHRLITRKPYDAGHRIYNVVNLWAPDDLDDEIRGWLAESYGFVE
jgi:hypothetical protein